MGSGGLRILGVVLGAGTAAVLTHLLIRPAYAATPGSPRERGTTPQRTRPSPQQPQRTSASMSKIQVDEADPQITKWEPVVAALAVSAGIPIPVAMAWLAIESGGNAAATGEPAATGPDGAPREIGLFQIYNPDDFKALGADPLELVAYTARPAPGARTKRDDDGGYKDGTLRNQQRLSRPLTVAEITRHVQLGINLINLKRRYADRYLTASSIAWPTSSPDYWATVKASHAWPPIVNTGLAKVTKHLGRPPSSWKEFRTAYEVVEPQAAQPKSLYYRALENAEWVGFHASQAAVS